MRIPRTLSFLFFIFLMATNLAAQNTPEIPETQTPVESPAPNQGDEPIKSFLLETKYNRFIKKNAFEIAPFVGPFLGEALPNSIFYGIRTDFFLTERLSFGATGGFSEAGFDPITLGTVTTQGNKNSHFTQGNLSIHFPVAMMVFRKNKVVQGDLFLTGGAGYFAINETYGFSGNMGGGIKVYWTRYLALRAEARNFFITAGPNGSEKFTSNSLMMLGLTFFFPHRQEETNFLIRNN